MDSTQDELQSREITRFSTYKKPHPELTSWYSIPSKAIVNIEHPCIIHNIDTGIETLGGNKSINRAVNTENRDYVLGLYLRPDDAMCNAVRSTNIVTNNVLLKITLPKRIGRKRKRGIPDLEMENLPRRCSVHEFQDSRQLETATSSTHPSVMTRNDDSRLWQSLSDNKDKYNIESVGLIEQTHRFRSMPDFIYSTTKSLFMNQIRDHILPYDYGGLKNFKFDQSSGVTQNTELLPPPSLSDITIPFNYSYKQNPAVKQTIDSSGRPTTINTQSAMKLFTQLVSYNVDTVPSEPPTGVPPFKDLDRTMQSMIMQLQSLFEERPIWTRRALLNHLTFSEYGYASRQSFQYVGYVFKSGPWRDAIVRFGVDPRADSQYRIYQTLMFQIFNKDQGGGRKLWEDDRTTYRRSMNGKKQDKFSHIFDGKRVVLDGKVWQVCDISDPLIKHLLSTANLRDECDIRGDGWYHNGTWAKAKIIMRAKIASLQEGGKPSDVLFAKIMELPDIIDSSSRHSAILSRAAGDTLQEVQLASEVRTMAGPPAKRKDHNVNAEGNDSLYRDDTGDLDAGLKLPEDINSVDQRMAKTTLKLGRAEQTSWQVEADDGTADEVDDSEQVEDEEEDDLDEDD
ncbi:MAG: tau 95 subunit of transcription factor TFIIIC [Pycnora praestabilis]|nr:MAG: tau 95 subunit of transcription factor TFIIIC [Pycnora praestabilis]